MSAPTPLPTDRPKIILTDLLNEATINNYGDALAPGSYYLSLNRYVENVVIVRPVAGSDYNVAVPAELNFTADTWDKPKLVRIFAAAATADRPVCPNGDLTCPALAPRTDTVTHTLEVVDSDSLESFLPHPFLFSVPETVQYGRG